jgi:hypothetical protein
MNISLNFPPEEGMLKFHKIMRHPIRIKIVMFIAGDQASVWHFESIMGNCQTKILQHWMLYRKGRFVLSFLQSRNLVYRFMELEVTNFRRRIAQFLQIILTRVGFLKLLSFTKFPKPAMQIRV